jgi:ElaB/YqjD/DUF883 family membrane-anchored ribosome-binding protein
MIPMNDPAEGPFVPNKSMDDESSVLASVHSIASQVEALICRHPLAAALTTLGIGCAVGLAAREVLAPAPTTKQRALDLLEDIRARLADVAEPVADRVRHVAEDSADAVKHGLPAASSCGLGQRLRSLFC